MQRYTGMGYVRRASRLERWRFLASADGLRFLVGWHLEPVAVRLAERTPVVVPRPVRTALRRRARAWLVPREWRV